MNTFLENFKTTLHQIEESFHKELQAIRTNRPHTGLVEDIKVSYYNELMPLKQIASVGVSLPRDIVIEPWDKTALSAIQKAVESSPLGLQARTDGGVVRVSLPELSSERRSDLIKEIKRLGEERRKQIRHTRDEVNKKIQQEFDNGGGGEDQKFKLKEDIQKQTEASNEAIEKLIEAKTKMINE